MFCSWPCGVFASHVPHQTPMMLASFITRHGGAVISDLHANFIVNDQGATCADILSLIDLCKRRVLEKFDIELQEEVKVFGAC